MGLQVIALLFLIGAIALGFAKKNERWCCVSGACPDSW